MGFNPFEGGDSLTLTFRRTSASFSPVGSPSFFEQPDAIKDIASHAAAVAFTAAAIIFFCFIVYPPHELARI
jgi:hypothetical protein